MQYKNMGGPWRQSDGTVVPRGGLFTPTERDLTRMIRRRQIGTLFVPVTQEELWPDERRESGEIEIVTEDAPSTSPGDQDPKADSTAGDDDAVKTADDSKKEPPAPWPLKMTPELYLKLHPEGQHAELARLHVTTE